MTSNSYKGKWSELISNEIKLDFTVENAKRVVSSGLVSDSIYTHQDIASWCEKFWNKYSDTDGPSEIENIMSVLADIETQWDLYLVNTYSLEELQKMEFSTVRMPLEWFEKWNAELNA